MPAAATVRDILMGCGRFSLAGLRQDNGVTSLGFGWSRQGRLTPLATEMPTAPISSTHPLRPPSRRPRESNELIPGEVRDVGEFVGHKAVGSAARYFVLTAQLVMVTQPVFEH